MLRTPSLLQSPSPLPFALQPPSIASPIDQSTSSANVHYNVEDGVATVYGSVDSQLEKTLVARDTAALDGVESFRNLLIVNN